MDAIWSLAEQVVLGAERGPRLPLPVVGLVGLAFGFFASTPTGPLNFMVIRRGLEGRRYAGAATAVGGTIVDTLFCAGALFGLQAILGKHTRISQNHLARFLMAAVIAGYGVYFIVWGVRNIDRPGPRKPQTYLHIQSAFLSGFLVTLFNPGLVACWFAISMALHAHHVVDATAVSRQVFAAGSFVGTLAWLLTLLLVVARYRRYVRLVWAKTAMRIFGAAMIAMGLWFVIRPLLAARGGA